MTTEQVRPGVLRRGPIEEKSERTPADLDPRVPETLDPMLRLPLSVLPWALLPPGTWDARTLVEHFEERAKRERLKHWDRERFSRICRELRPSQCWRGEAEFDGCVVFGFEGRSAVVMDTPLVGHALFIIRSDWHQLSRLSKRELLEDYPEEVRRIVHRGDWFERLRADLT